MWLQPGSRPAGALSRSKRCGSGLVAASLVAAPAGHVLHHCACYLSDGGLGQPSADNVDLPRGSRRIQQLQLHLSACTRRHTRL